MPPRPRRLALPVARVLILAARDDAEGFEFWRRGGWDDLEFAHPMGSTSDPFAAGPPAAVSSDLRPSLRSDVAFGPAEAHEAPMHEVAAA